MINKIKIYLMKNKSEYIDNYNFSIAQLFLNFQIFIS